MRELKIFSGQANRPLAKSICNFLHLPLAEITLGKFPDGENFCKIEEDIRGRDIFLVQPTCPPVNDNLVELLIMRTKRPRRKLLGGYEARCHS